MGAEEHEASVPLRHQRGPAQDERTQEDLAQLGVGLYESSDTLRGELEARIQERIHEFAHLKAE